MKRTAFNTLWTRILIPVWLLSATISSFAATCPDQEFTRTINREFGTTANGMTAIYNRYGKVNIRTWGENKVKIDITILVNAADQRSADKVFDRIKVNFTHTSGYVKAETVIEEQSGWWVNDGNDFKINYEVWMPVGNQLDLKNKYGNSYIADLNGKLMAEIKYGDLRAETIRNDADLYLGYGKAGIIQVQNLYGQVGYGELSVGTCNDLQMDTKYSQIRCDRANAMRITSKYDDLVVGTVDDMRLQTKYTDVKVQQARALFVTATYSDVRLRQAMEVVDANLTYGNLKVELLNKNFQSFNVVGKYTDVYLLVEPGATFRLDAEGSYTGMNYPKGVSIQHHVEDGNKRHLEGYLGSANAKGLVKVRMSYGDWLLK